MLHYLMIKIVSIKFHFNLNINELLRKENNFWIRSDFIMRWSRACNLERNLDRWVIFYLQLIVVQYSRMFAIVVKQDFLQVIRQCQLKFLLDKSCLLTSFLRFWNGSITNHMTILIIVISFLVVESIPDSRSEMTLTFFKVLVGFRA